MHVCAHVWGVYTHAHMSVYVHMWVDGFQVEVHLQNLLWFCHLMCEAPKVEGPVLPFLHAAGETQGEGVWRRALGWVGGWWFTVAQRDGVAGPTQEKHMG